MSDARPGLHRTRFVVDTFVIVPSRLQLHAPPMLREINYTERQVLLPQLRTKDRGS